MSGIRVNVNITYLVGREIKPRATVGVYGEEKEQLE